MQVIELSTRWFTGDVLLMNNEACGPNFKGGVSLWDVTDPLKPKKLSEHFGDRSALIGDVNTIHSVFGWQTEDGRAFIVMTDNEEFPDVDIMEITNPHRPRLIAELDLNDFGVAQPEIGLTDSFLHDMVVKQIDGEWLLLLSYWDGGWTIVNVDDPANPVYVADFEYPAVDPELLESLGVSLTPEGNAHQAEWTIDNRFIIGTDEDFAPYRTDEFEITTGPHAGVYPSVIVPGGQAPAILPDLTLNGPVVYGGYGCPDSDPIPSPEDIPGYLDMLEPVRKRSSSSSAARWAIRARPRRRASRGRRPMRLLLPAGTRSSSSTTTPARRPAASPSAARVRSSTRSSPSAPRTPRSTGCSASSRSTRRGPIPRTSRSGRSARRSRSAPSSTGGATSG